MAHDHHGQTDHGHANGGHGHGRQGGYRHGDHGAEAHDLDLDPSELAVCPGIPGSVVVKAEAEEDGLFRDYNGTRYYFCCDSCGPLWEADPAKYANA